MARRAWPLLSEVLESDHHLTNIFAEIDHHCGERADMRCDVDHRALVLETIDQCGGENQVRG